MKTPDPSVGNRPTAHDLAQAAGVRLTTVDRALKACPAARYITVKKMDNAIVAPGYVCDGVAASLARKRICNLLVVLPQASNEHGRTLEAQVALQTAKHLQHHTSLSGTHVPQHDPQALVETLDAPDASRANGVVVFGPEARLVRDAGKRTRARRIAMNALIADLGELYSSAAGNSKRIGCFEGGGLRQQVVVTAHERTSSVRTAFDRGIFCGTVFQNPGRLVPSIIRLVKAATNRMATDPARARMRNDY